MPGAICSTVVEPRTGSCRPMRMIVLIVTTAASPAAAAPLFVDRAGDLPVAHVYEGGWEHFVGGGVAVFDCNGDARPEIFVAGGTNPARLFVNITGGATSPLTFALGDAPPITGVTGAYPLDIDGDGAATSCCAAGLTAPSLTPRRPWVSTLATPGQRPFRPSGRRGRAFRHWPSDTMWTAPTPKVRSKPATHRTSIVLRDESTVHPRRSHPASAHSPC